MKNLFLAASAAFALATPFAASAHQMATYKIGNANYQFVIGSLNEPVAVDDKTSLDLTVSKCFTSACQATMGPDGDMDGPAGTPVGGLEESLKLQLIAGDQTKILSISPAYGEEGAYRAPFYFTVPTTVSYRLFGDVNGTAVDLTFTCVPLGTPHADHETTSVKISDGVIQTSKEGGFGCPSPKEDMGFPERSASIFSVNSLAKSAHSSGTTAIALAVIALVMAGSVFRRRQ